MAIKHYHHSIVDLILEISPMIKTHNIQIYNIEMPNFSDLIPLFFALTLIYPVSSRVTQKNVHLAEFSQIKQQAIFLTKFDIGVGTGKITVRLKRNKNPNNQSPQELSLVLGILKDTKYAHFRNLFDCQDRIPLYEKTIPVKFYDSYNARHIIQIQNPDAEHIYYVYLYDCNSQKQDKILTGTIHAKMTMYNNGSHLGEDQNFIAGYIITVTIWVVILIRFACPVYRSIQQSQGVQKFIFYASFLILGLGQFYYCLNLLMISYNGYDITLLFYLYVILKCIAQSVLVTTLVAIAWGWSITHLKHDITYLIIGTVISLVNITCLIIEGIGEDFQEAHHKYDKMTGMILLLLRLFILVAFIIGILKSISESVDKNRHFLKKFGIRGGCYLIAWPAAVVFVQLFLPNYMHKEVVTFSEDLSHLVAVAMVGYLFAFPNSDYFKVDEREKYMFNPF